MSSVPVKKTFLPGTAGASNEEDSLKQMRTLARDLVAEIFSIHPDQFEELLSALIAELALSTADQRRRQERRIRQAEGIAAAKARGVQFGRCRLPLPDDFDEWRLAWENGEVSLREAAESCGMEKNTFRRAVLRCKEQNAAAL